MKENNIKLSKPPLTIRKLPKGGFLVTEGAREERFVISSDLFAATKIEEALEFIKKELV